MSREGLIWTFDFDDVIAPTAEPLIEAYNMQYGTKITLDAMYSDDPATWEAGSNSEAVLRVSRLLRQGATANIAPTKKMIDALNRLVSLGDELHVVTGRQDYLKDSTLATIDQHLPRVFSSIEFTNFYVEEGCDLVTRSKGDVCRALNADVHVDDHIVHNSSVLDSGVQEVILWGNYPWNHEQKLERFMVRCVEIEELFRE